MGLNLSMSLPMALGQGPTHTRIKHVAWMGIGHTRIKHSPQVNWDQSTRSLLGCLKDPLISGLIQNISFEINWNLFCACQVLVAFPYIYLRSHAGVVLDRGQCAMCVVGHATHYPRGSSWEIDILPSRVVTDVKNKKNGVQLSGSQSTSLVVGGD